MKDNEKNLDKKIRLYVLVEFWNQNSEDSGKRVFKFDFTPLGAIERGRLEKL